MSGAVVIPSCNRAAQANALIHHLASSAPDQVVVLGINAHDPGAEEYRAVKDAHDRLRLHVKVDRTPPKAPSTYVSNVNAAAWVAFEHWNVGHVFVMGDDMIPPAEPGWFEELAEAAGSWGMSFPNDGDREAFKRRGALPTSLMMGRELWTALGEWVLPAYAMVHLYTDNYWLELGRRLPVPSGITYVPDVTVEHRHPSSGKAELDATYARGGLSRELMERDAAAFVKYRGRPGELSRLQRDVNRVLEAMGAPLNVR